MRAAEQRTKHWRKKIHVLGPKNRGALRLNPPIRHLRRHLDMYQLEWKDHSFTLPSSNPLL